MTTTLYAEYKASSDLSDLPDNYLALCDDCFTRTPNYGRTYIPLETTDYDCLHCSH